jgi:hypothetical protein
VALEDDLERIASAARSLARPGEELAAVIPAEPAAAQRVYLCAFIDDARTRTWLLLEESGRPVADRALVREAVSIAAMCELAEEVAGGGKLEKLRQQLSELRRTENPEGIDEAEDALEALAALVAGQPRLATPAHLDRVGEAARRLERALGDSADSPFAAALRASLASLEDLSRDVEAHYRLALA